MTKKIIVWTDGSCLGNPGAGGWAFVAIESDKVIKKSGGEPMTTNNRMELLAVISMLKYFKDVECISVHTDSEYVKNGITSWIKNWKKNNWRTASKQPVKNKDLWEELDSLVINKCLDWHWVKGHNGNEMNELCDQLAKSEAEKFL